MNQLKSRVADVINRTQNLLYVVVLPTEQDIMELQNHVVESCDFEKTSTRVIAILPDSEWNSVFNLAGIILYNNAMKSEDAMEKLKSNAPIETING